MAEQLPQKTSELFNRAFAVGMTIAAASLYGCLHPDRPLPQVVRSGLEAALGERMQSEAAAQWRWSLHAERMVQPVRPRPIRLPPGPDHYAPREGDGRRTGRLTADMARLRAEACEARAAGMTQQAVAYCLGKSITWVQAAEREAGGDAGYWQAVASGGSRTGQ